MSKAFTSEETPDDELVVRPRAPLPPSTPNYVTPRGLAALKEEHRTLEAERARVETVSDDAERRRGATELSVRLTELAARIATAEVVDPKTLMQDTVHFGALVTVRSGSGERRYQIVGADEADPAQSRIAFFAPLA
ncbi:MAG TPA: GreA/GreB family elongation factor, partial [Polyangiaceae bacterium]|nr:GreA/GreB family elongation factor [Polyangiaceae bacterium]